jgi:hypothetical protein
MLFASKSQYYKQTVILISLLYNVRSTLFHIIITYPKCFSQFSAVLGSQVFLLTDVYQCREQVCAGDVFVLALVAELSDHWEVTELVVFHQTRGQKGTLETRVQRTELSEGTLISRAVLTLTYMSTEKSYWAMS